MIKTLKERIEQYQTATDYKIIGRIPLIIVLNGKSFHKTTSLLYKPFSDDFIKIMSEVLLKLMIEVENSLFGFCYNDEIIIISYQNSNKNQDNNLWYNNNIQKIVSNCAAIATLELQKSIAKYNIQLLGDALFLAQIFGLPDLKETMNFLIHKQQLAQNISLQFAVFYELLKKGHQPDILWDELLNKRFEEKNEILQELCQINFENYDLCFTRGIAAYRTPLLMNDKLKNKLTLDFSLPLFHKEAAFLSNIFTNGKDVIRTIK